jgi:hypothetical protein
MGQSPISVIVHLTSCWLITNAQRPHTTAAICHLLARLNFGEKFYRALTSVRFSFRVQPNYQVTRSL